MTATVITISCLLVIAVSLSTPSGLGHLYEMQLQALSEVISGPAKGKSLALHLDTALPAEVGRIILGFEAIRRTPHLITLSLGLNDSHILNPIQETAGRASPCSFSFAPSLLHVLLWVTSRPEVIQTLWFHWKPRNLLIFSLGSTLGAEVLQDKALSGVEKLAFIGYIFGMEEQSPDALGVYTILPFSSSSVQLIGPWKSETFKKWETLFPDRFPSFEGYTFEVASFFRNPPYLYSSAANPEVGKGGDLQIFKAMANKLNYSYTLTQSAPDCKWGVIENGSWVGVLGLVARKEKNFTINGFYISKDRVGSFDPTEIVGRGQSSVFVPSPRPLPEWLSIVRPFSISAWVSFMAVIASAIFCMAFMVSII